MIRLHRALRWMLLLLTVCCKEKPVIRPNLSGTWVLNLKRSGPILPRGTEALTMVIDHHDPMMRTSETRTVAGKTSHSDSGITTIKKGRTIETSVAMDGKPSRSAKESMEWAGSSLMMHWEMT